MKKYNCLVAQSGGPTVAINASLAGIIQSALEQDSINTIYGAINGIQGVLNDNLLVLNDIFANDNNAIQTLMTSPAMYLGSCRYKLKDMDTTTEEYEQIFQLFERYDIHAFFYIGGNDSMDTVDKLSQYAQKINYDISIIGLPKTIDNDLMVTDHTPGFGSAAKFVATSVLEIAHDTYIYDLESVTIIEIMGRDAGWLTAAAALARNNYISAPDLIYLPERNFSCDTFIEDIKKCLTNNKNVIVAVSEGIHDENGNYISATNAAADKFGHAQLSGTGKILEALVKERIGCKVRSIELNVLQRSSMHCASLTDLQESFALGKQAVTSALNNENAIMLTIVREQNAPYQTSISSVPVTQVANEAKSVPLSWINEEGNDVTEDMLTYLRPLIEGEPDINYQNGLPVYLPISHLFNESTSNTK